MPATSIFFIVFQGKLFLLAQEGLKLDPPASDSKMLES